MYYGLFCFLLLVLLFSSLSAQAIELVAGSQYLSAISICKDIEENDPVLETTSFSVWDEKVICWIKFSYSSANPFFISWEWEDPSGNIYHDGRLEMEAGNYQNYRTWYEIGIRDRYARNFPGKWRVRVYLDGTVIAIKDFTIG